ncbi:putative aminohydrolase SsnA [Clostridium botulinum]|uniref:Selenium metabolism protein SsnA n=1 Tax=Clostridium botulinum (strain Eklund 17B / Type B) TaxID=935198 RepID=B2TKM6_CLOBB|nr:MULTISPECIES: putative aminohydrolase SsnA [unclassified Clostridium]ACD21933.1 putative selenium metabolism protein SsnA [Clostridium botulinum B str. Eklund 17B (NRP)]AIY80052.1 selenium metabolism SsnA family protein [Clostridium botulinum 202F]KAI3346352.1 putative aminohydrolase SsnA [Clostridium botulinum]KFX54262.1 chlorohydrolase [Clostridium botulinum]KFX58599.1 chlorohydrolase [Clostridium botulinum]
MLLVGNGRVITQDNKEPYLEDGCIAIKDNMILEVGNTDELKEKYKDYEFIDAEEKVIMPGLINTHHHIYSAFARGLTLNNPPSKSLIDILENVWWKIDKKLTLEDVKYSTYTTLIECVKNGVTTVFDHHASPMSASRSLFTIADAATHLGIRGVYAYEVSDRDGDEILNEGIEENVNFIKVSNEREDDMVKGMFGMHASFTLSDESLKKCVNSMKGLDAGYHIHAAEGIDDLNHCLKNNNKRVIERLNDFGILGEKTICAHCIHINKREIDILKETNTNVVNNPESNMGNAVGCAPVMEMMKNEVVVGLGTDGYTSDMFESMKVENIIHKHNLCNSNVGFVETNRMLFENNRNIAGKYFTKPLGILKEGAYADLIIVDYNPLTPMNENNLNGHIMFGMSGRGVDTTIINGKVVMKNRQIITVNEDKIFKESRKISGEFWKNLN